MNNLVPGRSAWMLLAGFAALALSLVALLAACGGDAVPSRLRKKGVSVKLPCKLSPELDDIRPKRVLKSRTLLFSW